MQQRTGRRVWSDGAAERTVAEWLLLLRLLLLRLLRVEQSHAACLSGCHCLTVFLFPRMASHDVISGNKLPNGG